MSIRSPQFQWPAVLDERGPSSDPSILLTGTARFADKDMQVIAVRVDPSRRCAPDCGADAIGGCYQTEGFEAVLGVILEELDFVAGELSDLLGNDATSIVEFENSPYIVCMIPTSSRRSAS